MRKAWVLGGLVAAGLLIKSQQKDIARYFKIKQMSLGGGHPENVPAEGSRRYPAAGHGAADGTGDFDAQHRGGSVESKSW